MGNESKGKVLEKGKGRVNRGDKIQEGKRRNTLRGNLLVQSNGEGGGEDERGRREKKGGWR